MNKEKFYFTTRDLMVMAALAALGGVASTYVNLIGDFFQSLLGFAGTTQWAAGLHIIWITLAALLVGKPGAATTAGILKGFVELFSGNSHGLLVVIIDITAGLIIDLFLIFNSRKKMLNIWLCLAAGLASASNVIIFQAFAAVPGDLLTVAAILAASSVAFISGVIFSGLVSMSIIASLRKIGLIAETEEELSGKKIVPNIIIAIGTILAAFLGFTYFSNLTMSEQITISGNVAQEMLFPDDFKNQTKSRVESRMNGALLEYEGYTLREILSEAKPNSDAGILVITATDSYSFFIPFEEIERNPDLFLSEQMIGKKIVYNIVGAESPKARVRGVSEIAVISVEGLRISGDVLSDTFFFPQDHLSSMDSAYLEIDGESEKLQGVPLVDVLNSQSDLPPGNLILVNSPMDVFQIQYDSVARAVGDIRIFLRFHETDIEFILGEMTGTVLLRDVEGIEIKS